MYRPLYSREVCYSVYYRGESCHTASNEAEKIKYLLLPGIELRFDDLAARKIVSPLVVAVDLCIFV